MDAKYREELPLGTKICDLIIHLETHGVVGISSQLEVLDAAAAYIRKWSEHEYGEAV